ncbi:putative 3-demethylubiquinone-9 3-methyltransferase (glyoxalase superfamily) [Paraburkholderia sp. GAS448]|jgi:predicted 3-demethylubiquinone-9 3-methyltransferase (glyoxalase superfamily)|uniref:VOC family protein n=1 Tax=Paraburkholderia sp. GAS448 TaxID=3035136 RepID=UPI003D19FEB7
MQKISPFLWFNDKAEEAAMFYTSIFRDSRIGDVMRYGEAGPGPKGGVMAVTFQLEGQEFMALNGGPEFAFTPAISFFVKCETQQEIDGYWDRLMDGGEPMQCGWIKDRFGLTWQIVPNALGRMLQDKDAAKAKRVMEAMMKMIKLDINVLEEAYRRE